MISTIVNLMVNLCFAVQLILYVLNGVEILANRVQWHVVDIVLLQEFSGDPGYMRAGIVLHQCYTKTMLTNKRLCMCS